MEGRSNHLAVTDEIVAQHWLKEFNKLGELIEKYSQLPSMHGPKFVAGQLAYWERRREYLLSIKPESVILSE